MLINVALTTTLLEIGLAMKNIMIMKYKMSYVIKEGFRKENKHPDLSGVFSLHIVLLW